MYSKIESLRTIIGINLKRLRKESRLTQKNLAAKSGVSFRLIQDIESCRSNPTLVTLLQVCTTLNVTTEALFSLTCLRLNKNAADFIISYRKAFKDFSMAAGLRTLNGISLWGNLQATHITGGMFLQDDSKDLLKELPKNRKTQLLQLLKVEQKGFTFSFTTVVKNQSSQQERLIRVKPCLIYPKTGNTPILTSILFLDVGQDTEKWHLEYNRRLIKIAVQS